MQVNWKVRARNKAFWIAIIPTTLLLAQQIASLFGVTLDLGDASNRLLSIVETVFIMLAALGIVNDPTTEGLRDSELAMTYEVPKRAGQATDPTDPDATAELGRHVKRGE